MFTVFLLAPLALAADPWDDRLQRSIRKQHKYVLGTDMDARDTRFFDLESAPFLHPRLDAMTLDRGLVAEPTVEWGFGSADPFVADGTRQAGLVGLRTAIRVSGFHGPLEVNIRPETAMEGWPAAADVRLRSWWAGARFKSGTVGMGAIPRRVGPARYGSLIMSRNATPLPGAGGVLRGNLPAGIGTWRLNAHGGIIPGQRQDVENPGWMLLDARMRLGRWAEVGASRGSLFGGKDEAGLRPIDLGQLLLPTQPHVEDDPEQRLPDTDESAAWDILVQLPLTRFRMDLWIQHGGEDLVTRRLGPLPWPTLAGVANVYGGSLDVGTVFLEAEFAVVEDDRFRWYRGHRIYHEGWSFGGASLGHPNGGDQSTVRVTSGIDRSRDGGELAMERSSRTAVVDVVGNSVFSLPAIEHTTAASARVHRRFTSGWWSLALRVQHIQNRRHVPDDDVIEFGLQLSLRTDPVTTEATGRSVNRPSP
jgi:hypothetical protein